MPLFAAYPRSINSLFTNLWILGQGPALSAAEAHPLRKRVLRAPCASGAKPLSPWLPCFGLLRQWKDRAFTNARSGVAAAVVALLVLLSDTLIVNRRHVRQCVHWQNTQRGDTPAVLAPDFDLFQLVVVYGLVGGVVRVLA